MHPETPHPWKSRVRSGGKARQGDANNGVLTPLLLVACACTCGHLYSASRMCTGTESITPPPPLPCPREREGVHAHSRCCRSPVNLSETSGFLKRRRRRALSSPNHAYLLSFDATIVIGGLEAAGRGRGPDRRRSGDNLLERRGSTVCTMVVSPVAAVVVQNIRGVGR